uniref:Twin-arginine translocation pathway signal n=1 Tax=Caulobacter sp. (strain K31) TaxID=366602 RepID=B0SY64_CAUSK
MTVGMKTSRRDLVSRGCAAAGVLLFAAAPLPAWADAAMAQKIADDSRETLAKLYAQSAKSRVLGANALAVLVFPRIAKAGLLVDGWGGQGALITGATGEASAFYEIFSATFGLQAGAQTFSYVLFFITESSLDSLKKGDGWSIGSGPSVVVVDQGMAETLNTTTLTQDVYAVPFGQYGLMAGLGLEGSKITRIHPTP